jgi:voltage-gated potassium channel
VLANFIHRLKKRKRLSLGSLIRTRKRQIWRLFFFFVTVIVLHTVAMVIFEGMDWWQGVWLTMTSASTTGYGDISAATPAGQIATIVLIYFFGISLLAQIASEFIEYRIEQRERKIKGQWEWSEMQNHIVIVNAPVRDSERYLKRLVGQINIVPELKALNVVLLSSDFSDGLPSSLIDMGLVHYTGVAESNTDLLATGIDKAKYVLTLVKDVESSLSDSYNFDVVSRIRDLNDDCQIICECIEDDNRIRIKKAGANSVIRPVRAYPEIMVRALSMPGTETLLEDMFTHEGAHTQRYDVELQGIEWRQVASHLMDEGAGTALGYVDINEKVITNPRFDSEVHCLAILVLVRDDQIPTLSDIEISLANLMEHV